MAERKAVEREARIGKKQRESIAAKQQAANKATRRQIIDEMTGKGQTVRIKAAGGDRAKNLEDIADAIQQLLPKDGLLDRDKMALDRRAVRELWGWAEQLKVIANELEGSYTVRCRHCGDETIDPARQPGQKYLKGQCKVCGRLAQDRYRITVIECKDTPGFYVGRLWRNGTWAGDCPIAQENRDEARKAAKVFWNLNR